MKFIPSVFFWIYQLRAIMWGWVKYGAWRTAKMGGQDCFWLLLSFSFITQLIYTVFLFLWASTQLGVFTHRKNKSRMWRGKTEWCISLDWWFVSHGHPSIRKFSTWTNVHILICISKKNEGIYTIGIISS